MSAAEALQVAHAAGVELRLDGDDLALSAASAPPAAVLDALSRHKAEIVALLRLGPDGWSAEDWQVYFEERAGIIEFDGGLPRAEAEARAFECCVVEWLNRNPAHSPARTCLGCGGREDTADKLRLAAFALLGSMARSPESRGARRPITDPGGRLMGKRSDFERREADFYPTPRAAVVPLIPHLRGTRSFAEPCAGDSDLVRHLEEFGFRCVYAGDIRTGQDALELDSYGPADAIITNPPYTRELMHRLIEHFQRIAPTWLLLDSDWASTRQAVPFLDRCSIIVAIGRVKWIEGSKYTGKDNHAWYRFNARQRGGPVFRGRDPSDIIPTQRTRVCEQCRKSYEPQRSSSRFCSETCRQRAHRKRLGVTLSVTPAPTPITPIEPSDSSEISR